MDLSFLYVFGLWSLLCFDCCYLCVFGYLLRLFACCNLFVCLLLLVCNSVDTFMLFIVVLCCCCLWYCLSWWFGDGWLCLCLRLRYLCCLWLCLCFVVYFNFDCFFFAVSFSYSIIGFCWWGWLVVFYGICFDILVVLVRFDYVSCYCFCLFVYFDICVFVVMIYVGLSILCLICLYL